MKNYNHDLIHQLSEMLDSAWRFKEYAKNAKGNCADCHKMWQDIKKGCEDKIEKIKRELVLHAKKGLLE